MIQSIFLKRIVGYDIFSLIYFLNERYFLDDSSYYQFDLVCVNDEFDNVYQIIFRLNFLDRYVAVTSVFSSSTECIDDFYEKLDKYGWGWVDSFLDSFF